MGGSVNVCQSVEDPLRTINALVKAAKVMPIVAMPTHIPVDAGAGECSFVLRRSLSAGTRLRPPPLPERAARSSSLPLPVCGGSWTVVAIVQRLLHFNYCSSRTD